MKNTDCESCPIPPVQCSHYNRKTGSKVSKFVCDITGENCRYESIVTTKGQFRLDSGTETYSGIDCMVHGIGCFMPFLIRPGFCY